MKSGGGLVVVAIAAGLAWWWKQRAAAPAEKPAQTYAAGQSVPDWVKAQSWLNDVAPGFLGAAPLIQTFIESTGLKTAEPPKSAGLAGLGLPTPIPTPAFVERKGVNEFRTFWRSPSVGYGSRTPFATIQPFRIPT